MSDGIPKATVVRERSRPSVITMEILNRRLEEHSEQDQRQLGEITAELSRVRTEQATKSQTYWQTLVLALIQAIAVVAAAVLAAGR